MFVFNSPTINVTKFYVKNGTEVVWSNKTVKWTYKYEIFAVDGGSPKRGDSIPLTITFDASCESTGAVVADPQTGQVFFRAPGLTGSIYRKQLSLRVLSICENWPVRPASLLIECFILKG